MTTFNRLPEKPNVPPPLHKLSNELARIGVIYKSPHQLTLPAKSLRVHTTGQIKKIGRSLSVFGFLIPIVIDEADRVLVGVGRLSAARDLGLHRGADYPGDTPERGTETSFCHCRIPSRREFQVAR